MTNSLRRNLQHSCCAVLLGSMALAPAAWAADAAKPAAPKPVASPTPAPAPRPAVTESAEGDWETF